MEDTQAEQPPPTPNGSAATPPASAEKSEASRADEIKSWSDAATALFKAVLLAMAIVLVAAVSGVAIWRDFHSRVLVVDVSQDAEKTLRILGADVDLRFALRDALNERVAGVQQIIAVQGLSIAGAAADAISFKPFGLELSTDDVTRVVDLVFGRPARPTVRLELLCAPRPCTDPAARQATLVANLSGPSGSRTASYQIMLGNRGLGRSLHQSIERIADLVLEQSEPQIASVLFGDRAINGPVQSLTDQIRAEGAAVAGRTPDANGCLADLVIGGSLVSRGEMVAGVAAERRAGMATNVVCKVHGDTNIVFLMQWKICNHQDLSVSRYADDQVARALGRLAALGTQRGAIDDQVYFRIPAANLTSKIIQVLCPSETVLRGAARNTAAAQLQALLVDARAMLPSDAHTLMQHEILDMFWAAMQFGLKRDDLAGRLSFGRALMDAIRRSQVNDPHPRDLFILQGRLAMATARAAIDALDSADPAQQSRLTQMLDLDQVTAQSRPDMILAAAVDRNFNEAAVAFENAFGTTPMAPLFEPVSDPEILGLLGDVWYAAGNSALARAAYTRAVDRFIEADEPVEQVLPVTLALAGWATVLIGTGACEDQAQPDPGWTDHWTQLGDKPPDVCQLAKRDDGTEIPTQLAIMQKMLRHVMECYVPPAPESAVDHNAHKSWRDAYQKRFGLLDCYASKLIDLSRSFPPAAEAIDAEIARALGAQH